MQIHLSDVTSCEGKTIQVSTELEMETVSFQMGEFPVLKKEPVDLVITNTGNKVLELTGNTCVTVGIPCDRCLEQVKVEIPCHIERKLDMKLTDEERVNDLDESNYLTGMDLDVDRLVYLEVLMSWPLKVLCRDDCKAASVGKTSTTVPADVQRSRRIPAWQLSVIYLVNLRRCNLCPYVQRTKHLKQDAIKDVQTGR